MLVKLVVMVRMVVMEKEVGVVLQQKVGHVLFYEQ